MNSSSSDNTSNPTADQLATTRAEHWHQADNALHTIEAMREWINRSGLVVFSARPQLGAPAPSLVEAALGTANAAPALNEAEGARSLLARLIAEGNAVPLNLMGVTGGTGTDTPDFVASAAVFSYIFTLRGNKAWKQPPATSGAVKVSPLALAIYDVLAAKVTMSAYDLATQLGKEVTEAAVLRSLTELWGQLRVIPVPQQDGSATLWEPASSRFTKQIKAGANAGQPSALSALISLYLGQALAATEDEIESFLSPLAPRSRVRDVLHALLSARQLETLVIGGKTLLYVGGDAPAFLKTAAAPVEEAGSDDAPVDPDAPRITKFTPRPGSKIGTGLRARPAFGRPAGGGGARPGYPSDRAGAGSRPAYGKPAGDRERRPFVRDDRAGAGSAKPGFDKPRSDGPRSDKPRFDKPWQDRPARPAAEGLRAEGAGEAAAEPQRPAFGNRAGGERAGGERTFAPRPRFGGGREESGSRPPRREFAPRPDGEAPRRTFSKPGTFGRKREGFAGPSDFGGSAGRPPRREFGSAEGRPPRRESGGREERPSGGGFRKPGFSASASGPRAGGFAAKSGRFAGQSGTFARKPGGFSDAPRTSTSRPPSGEGEGAAPRKVFRKFDAPRERKPFGDKPAGGRSFTGKSFGSKPAGDRPAGQPFGSRPAFGGSGERPAAGRPRPEGRGGFQDRPAGGGFGAKKPYAKPGGAAGGASSGAAGGSGTFSKGGGPFAKFADGKKPFRKPGQPRPKRDEGYGPVKRRPAGNS